MQPKKKDLDEIYKYTAAAKFFRIVLLARLMYGSGVWVPGFWLGLGPRFVVIVQR